MPSQATNAESQSTAKDRTELSVHTMIGEEPVIKSEKPSETSARIVHHGLWVTVSETTVSGTAVPTVKTKTTRHHVSLDWPKRIRSRRKNYLNIAPSAKRKR